MPMLPKPIHPTEVDVASDALSVDAIFIVLSLETASICVDIGSLQMRGVEEHMLESSGRFRKRRFGVGRRILRMWFRNAIMLTIDVHLN